MMTTLIDVHTHLDAPHFKNDLHKVVENAVKNNVTIMVSNGTNPESNQRVLKLAGKYPEIKPALGIHPEDYLVSLGLMEQPPLPVQPFDAGEELKTIEKLIKIEKNGVVAIGEIGLDNYWVKGQLDVQLKLFHQLLDLAKRVQKPVIVHSRAAEQPCLDAIYSSNVKASKVILHCFSGSKAVVKQGADAGYSFSIPTNVVRASSFQDIVKNVELNQLFTETDAPFLGPFKNERNEPSNIVHSIKKIAEIKGFTEHEVADNILLNWKKMMA